MRLADFIMLFPNMAKSGKLFSQISYKILEESELVSSQVCFQSYFRNCDIFESISHITFLIPVINGRL